MTRAGHCPYVALLIGVYLVSLATPSLAFERNPNLLLNAGYEVGSLQYWTPPDGLIQLVSDARTGNYSAAFGYGTGRQAYLSQAFTTKPSVQYNVSVFVAIRRYFGNDEVWSIQIDGHKIFERTQAAEWLWLEAFALWTARNTTSNLTLSVYAGGNNLYFDDWKAFAVCQGQQMAYPFHCIHGTWTTPDGQEAVVESGTTITFPTETVIINGDLTVEPSAIIEVGYSTSITVGGCVSLDGSQLQISLTGEETEQILTDKNSRTLTLMRTNCSTPEAPAQIGTSVKLGKTTCASVKASSKFADRELVTTFRVDKLGCNRSWIIAVSVVGGFIILFVVIFAIVATTNKRLKTKLRPFWARHNPAPEATQHPPVK